MCSFLYHDARLSGSFFRRLQVRKQKSQILRFLYCEIFSLRPGQEYFSGRCNQQKEQESCTNENRQELSPPVPFLSASQAASSVFKTPSSCPSFSPISGSMKAGGGSPVPFMICGGRPVCTPVLVSSFLSFHAFPQFIRKRHKCFLYDVF